MTPKDAKTFDEVCSLQEDNFEFDYNQILTDGSMVTIWNRNRESINISRTSFNALVDWYCANQEPRND